MTVSSTTARVAYSGNGSTVAFSVTFYFLANTDLQVIIRAADGTETVKTITTDYTVTGAGDPAGGTVTFGTAPASGTTVVIVRNVPLTQQTDYQANDPFPAETHESALDKLTMLTQQIQDGVNRSIKLSKTNTMTSTEFTVGAANRANKILAFDSAGEIAVTQEIGTYRGNWASGTAYQQRDLIKDTSNNNIYICVTAHTASGSQPISTNTDAAKWALIVDAASAASSATAAALSEAAAEAAELSANNWATKTDGAVAGGEYSAKYHALAAASSATDAETAQTAAESAQSAAESARDSTLAAFDSFDDRYLGTKTSDPTLDNDGNALVAGALYFNSVSGIMKVYTGSAWVAAYVSAEGLLSAANNLSDLDSAPTALTNLGGTTVGKAVFTAATVAAAQQAMDVEVGVDVQAYDADTAKTDTAQTFTASQRGTVTTDNDGSLDLNVTNNFKITPTGNFTLTFTNITAGQSGFILLVNSGGYTVSAHANTKVSSTALATISAAGTYVLSYFSDSSAVYVVNSGALS